MIDEKIKEMGGLEIVVDNTQQLLKEDNKLYALARRAGLGATDASVYLGVNLYTTVDALIMEKQSTIITEEELAIGKKPAVRKGADLEPLTLQKFADLTGLHVEKPLCMYRIKEYPQLTVNFDGVTKLGNSLIPVEAKYVSKYGAKYFDIARATNNGTLTPTYLLTYDNAPIKEHIERNAKLCGVPPYYYTQVQQQILALNSPFGYLVGLFDEPWEINVFAIKRDEATIEAIIHDSSLLWRKIKKREAE